MATSVTVNSGNSPYTISPAGPIPSDVVISEHVRPLRGRGRFHHAQLRRFSDRQLRRSEQHNYGHFTVSPRSVPNTVSAPPAASDEWHGLRNERPTLVAV